MAIEWVAISAAVIPFLKKYAADRCGKLADGVLAGVYRRIVPDEKLEKANEAFVTQFSKELDSAIELPTVQARAYQKALKRFLSNPSVAQGPRGPR
jgi:hypothetical protein